METAVGSFAIAGATLAQIMHDFGSVEGDCDGILFGRVQHQTSSRMQDDDGAMPAVPQQQVIARVTGYFCSGRVQSFYDSAGRLDHSKLLGIVTDRQTRGEDLIIGWFVGRRNSTLLPSMREAAVTAYLRSGITATGAVAVDNKTLLARPDMKSGQRISGGDPPSSPISSATRRKSVVAGDSLQSGPVASCSTMLNPSLGLDSSASPNKRNVNSSNPHGDGRREPSGSSQTSRSPCCFLLLTESDSSNNAVRTHEYRAFQSFQSRRGLSFEPLPVSIVNAGLSMRGFYDSFVPVASIPSWFNDTLSLDISERNDQRSPGGRGMSRRSVGWLENNGGRSSRKAYQDTVNSGLEGLTGLETGEGGRVSRFESLYEQMLARLEKFSMEAYDIPVSQHKSHAVSQPKSQ